MSVRKRTWTTQQGEKREAWVVDYADRDGERHIETFDRKKDADARHAEVKVDVKAGVHVAPSKSATVAEAASLWLDGVKPRIERATHVDYSGHVLRFIKPALGPVKLSDLTSARVRTFEDKLRETHSDALVRKVLTTFGTLVADAQERGLVARNVVHDLMRSRKGKRNGEKRQKPKLKVGVDIPTPDEVKAILGHTEGRWRPLLVTAVFTGLRASELRAIRWCDVDLNKCELHVRQRADRFKTIGRPKSQAGERTVPFGKIVANTLKEWKLTYPRPLIGKRDGEGKPEREPHRFEHLVFPTGIGTVEDLVNIVKRGFIPAGIAAGVTITDENGAVKAKYTGLHSLRHFYASWLINSPADGGLGLPPKTVQARLGHASITITYDRYGHLFPRGDDAEELSAAELRVIGAALKGGSK